MSPNRKLGLGAAAAALVAGSFFALDFSPDITLDGITLAPTSVNVTAGPQTINCALQFTSTFPILDATCRLRSTGGLSRSCTAATEAPAGTWACDIALQEDIEGGTWTLEYVSARDTNTPETKLGAWTDEILADPPATLVPANLLVSVQSDTPDTTGPTITATVANPNSVYAIWGGPVTCTNTLTDTGAVRETGCSVDGDSCTAYFGTGNDWPCNLDVPPGAVRTVNIAAFARDQIGNRSRYEDNATVSANGEGLTYSTCNTSAAGNGQPLAIDLDNNGDAWVLGEFHTHLQHITDAGPCGTSDQYFIPRNGNIFWSGNSNSGTSVLGEGLDYDLVNDKVWFSQGGGLYECDELESPTFPCSDVNHSRVGEFTPGPNTFRMFNLPGVRNESMGVLWDAARNWVWVAEGGFYSDFVAGDVHQGTILAFDPDYATWNNALSSGAGWDPGCSPLCTGGQMPGNVGAGVPGCMKRYQLPAAAFNPAHMALDADGYIWWTNFWGTSIGRLNPATSATILYPEPVARSPQSPIVGSGTWAIHLSPDGEYVVWNEYFDGQLSRMRVSDGDDAACQSLDGSGLNPCMEHVDVGSSGGADHDIDTDSIQGLDVAPNGAYWFSTGGPLSSTPGSFEAKIGFVDPDFKTYTFLTPSAFTPNYNPNADVHYKDMVIDPTDCTVWVSEGPGPSPANPGVARFQSIACPSTTP